MRRCVACHPALWGVYALGGTISEPAWKTKPSWYLVSTDDRMIPPPAQRFMSERAGATVVGGMRERCRFSCFRCKLVTV